MLVAFDSTALLSFCKLLVLRGVEVEGQSMVEGTNKRGDEKQKMNSWACASTAIGGSEAQ
jgi:hypothetical protein